MYAASAYGIAAAAATYIAAGKDNLGAVGRRTVKEAKKLEGVLENVTTVPSEQLTNCPRDDTTPRNVFQNAQRLDDDELLAVTAGRHPSGTVSIQSSVGSVTCPSSSPVRAAACTAHTLNAAHRSSPLARRTFGVSYSLYR